MGNTTSANAVSLAIVVIANWLIHNLAVDWSMPPEVQSACQSIITVFLTWWLSREGFRLNGSFGNGSGGGTVAASRPASPTVIPPPQRPAA